MSSIREEIVGVQATKVYYQPKYDLGETRIPDFRTQLLWNPLVILKPGQEKELTFFTSDDFGHYVIDIQGLTDDGYPFTFQEFLEVVE